MKEAVHIKFALAFFERVWIKGGLRALHVLFFRRAFEGRAGFCVTNNPENYEAASRRVLDFQKSGDFRCDDENDAMEKRSRATNRFSLLHYDRGLFVGSHLDHFF